ncbi:MAG: hypothetical protein LN410_00490 [Candidatus Thermoplasmatota archaeon]|nr:hypothetical protein [Candidatus Thermoplasmatota archaeon]
MMENLNTLFLRDLYANEPSWKWRPLVFYGVFVLGMVVVLLESYFLSGNMTYLRLFTAIPNPMYQWVAFGLAGALLAFKKEIA